MEMNVYLSVRMDMSSCIAIEDLTSSSREFSCEFCPRRECNGLTFLQVEHFLFSVFQSLISTSCQFEKTNKKKKAQTTTNVQKSKRSFVVTLNR